MSGTIFFLEADVRAGVYFNREGWSGWEWAGVERDAFVTADTSETSGEWLNVLDDRIFGG